MSPSLEAQNSPWIDRSFLKDAKLRVRERYWTELSSSTDNNLDRLNAQFTIIPDALTWRKYLRLIKSLVMEQTFPMQWCLLESTVEYMDYRNQSPILMKERREAAAPQERSTLQHLVERKQILPFCDLSIREEDDEWDMLNYNGLSIQERSRHAWVRAARFIRTIQPDSTLLLLCDTLQDLDDLQLERGIQLLCIHDLFSFLEEQKLASGLELERLKELKMACRDDYERRNRPKETATEADSQEEYLSEDHVQQGLRSGKLVRGRLDVTKENPKEAYVSADGQKFFVDILRDHHNRTFHQDKVIVQPLPENQWGRPVGKRRLVVRTNDDDDYDRLLDDNDALPFPSARVVALKEPARRIFVATMVNAPLNDESAVLVVPMDVRVPKIRLHTHSWRTFVKMRLLVEVDGWEVGSNYPYGRCREVIGPIGDLETEISCLLHECQIELEPFSAAAQACLPPEGDSWTVPEAEVQKRKDLRRSRRIFSVDPPGCQDIDDTMHAQVLPTGDIEVGVHIADVTAFVQHNSALDIEAQARGTTFYLVDRRFDMLPSLLSSNLCSLHGGVDRLALSVIWTLSPDFNEVKSTWYGRTIIHNCAAMTYDQADNILNDKTPDDPDQVPPPPLTAGAPVKQLLVHSLKEDLSMLTRLARKLRNDREGIGGAVDLSSGDLGTELKFTLDSGKPTRVAVKADKEIHHTIAEVMIMANTYVASKIYECFPDVALLRIHRTVKEERFEDLRDVLKAGKISFDGSSNMALANSLRSAECSGNSTVNALFRSLATRAMSEAQYICTGDKGHGADFSHYGLGLSRYTHFTSPIRRYADIVVHKQLIAALSIKKRSPIVHAEDPKTARQHLQSVPDSSVISVLAGEATEASEGDKIIDSMIEGASELVLTVKSTKAIDKSAESNTLSRECNGTSDTRFYDTSEVSRICEGLNLHNRLAKRSSFQCQNLFLSLYFRDHFELAEAVVTSLRLNGFWVYVPKFDLKGPVFVKDVNGCIQMDPAFFSLQSDSGLPPTLAFAASERCRRFPSGKCELVTQEDERLEVIVDEGTARFVVRPLDTVTVRVVCDNWDDRARVPSPRLQLTPSGRSEFERMPSEMSQIRFASGILSESSDYRGIEKSVSRRYEESLNMFNLTSVNICPSLTNVRLLSSEMHKPEASHREGNLQGRFVYNGFINPDTRSAIQDAAQQTAAAEAAQRRAKAVEHASRRRESETSQKIEKSITSRQQRLTAEKRNTRKSKAK